MGVLDARRRADESGVIRVEERMPKLTTVERFSIAEAVISFIGAGIAGTIWWADRNAVDLPCTASGGCQIVAQSHWSHITVGPLHDIPVALLGFLTYVGLLIVSAARYASDSPSHQRFLFRLLMVGSAFGTAYSWYLQYIAHFRIGAFCVWCFSSALVMTLLIIITTWEIRTPQSSEKEPLASHG